MATAKKHVREGSAYPGFRQAALEEFGDALWYLTALCQRRSIEIDAIFGRAAESGGFDQSLAASDLESGAVACISTPSSNRPMDDVLFRLARTAGELLDPRCSDDVIVEFASAYLAALHAAEFSFADVVSENIKKVRSAFVDPDLREMPDFDREFGPEEQLPRDFRIRINQRSSGKSYLQWNGVFIGDPLTDNIGDPDGYRFHDVFHFAYAAVLHWSPVLRALIKHKRKSRAEYDEKQDGGRAIVVEEGIAAWLFARAKDLNYFEGQRKVSLDILKTVREFSAGFEVEACPMKLWERAILQGFEVFRMVRAGQGGWVIGSRETRSLTFAALEAAE
ncbi:MAG TPA: pyrophosphatase [Xanthomonadaceae bacterium]|nr:pyrophosphatase [Xanthomonadaceae bacterium]